MGALKLSSYYAETENNNPLMKVVHNVNEPPEDRLNSYLPTMLMPGINIPSHI